MLIVFFQTYHLGDVEPFGLVLYTESEGFTELGIE